MSTSKPHKDVLKKITLRRKYYLEEPINILPTKPKLHDFDSGKRKVLGDVKNTVLSSLTYVLNKAPQQKYRPVSVSDFSDVVRDVPNRSRSTSTSPTKKLVKRHTHHQDFVTEDALNRAYNFSEPDKQVNRKRKTSTCIPENREKYRPVSVSDFSDVVKDLPNRSRSTSTSPTKKLVKRHTHHQDFVTEDALNRGYHFNEPDKQVNRKRKTCIPEKNKEQDIRVKTDLADKENRPKKFKKIAKPGEYFAPKPATSFFVGNLQIPAIRPNIFTDTNTFISSSLRRSKRQPKLRRKIINHADRPYVGDIFNTEYCEEIHQNLLESEKKHMLDKSFLKTFKHDPTCRTTLVNWMLQLQSSIKFTNDEFYISVKMLDCVLSCIAVPMNMYQLLSIAILWIVMKAHSFSDNIKGSLLLSFCNDTYHKKQLLEMESTVLRFFNFHIHIVEPTLYFYNYMKVLNLEYNKLLELSVCYILDSLALTTFFSTTPISVLAAGALNTALTKLHKKNCNFFEYTPYKYNINELKTTEQIFNGLLVDVEKGICKATEPIAKYSTAENMKVSTMLIVVDP